MTKEEAIEVLKKKVEYFESDKRFKAAVETLIPELKESEDERIIKTLQEYVKNRNWPLNGPTQDEVLAWLEKQKEMPTDEEMLRTLRCEYEKGVADTIAKYEQKEQKPSIFPPGLGEVHFNPILCEQKEQKPQMELVYRMNALMLDYIKDTKDPEEQKHRLKCYELFWEALEDADYQKPAEWKPTEEQFNYLAKAIMTLGEEGDCKTAGVLSEIRNGLKCSFPDWKISSDYPEEGCNVSLNGEVKKIQEWSEEDKEMLNLAELAIWEGGHLSQGEAGKVCRWIKNRCQQPKPEWSEEDEKMIDHLVEALPRWANAQIAILPSQAEEYAKRLKSIRPQPKPEVECNNETEIQKAYREGKNAGRKEVFDHPEEYGLQLRRLYDYETGKKNPEWSEEDKEWLSEVYFAIDHSMYSEDERQAMKNYIDSLRKDRKTCDVDEFSLTLRNCLSADSELSKEQADTFARTYGEDLYKAALGEMKTGLDKEDIEEYRNEVEFNPKPGEKFWVRCKTEKSENLWFDKGDERPAHAIQGFNGMMYVVYVNKDVNGNCVSYRSKDKFLETFEIIKKPE